VKSGKGEVTKTMCDITEKKSLFSALLVAAIGAITLKIPQDQSFIATSIGQLSE